MLSVTIVLNSKSSGFAYSSLPNPSLNLVSSAFYLWSSAALYSAVPCSYGFLEPSTPFI
jgi:hypothetical protein